MRREGMTRLDAAHEWVREFNAFPYGMIDKLMSNDPDEWSEITKPSIGDRVYVYDVPEGYGHYGSIHNYDMESGLYFIEPDKGEEMLTVETDDFEVDRDGRLPMWGTLWQFGDSADDYWLEEMDGIQVMSDCGFRIYEHEEFGYFFGIDGAGFDFYEAFWEPLYKARGLQWHDPAAEKERQMQLKGYKKKQLGSRLYWFDGDKCIEEAQRDE